MKIDLLDIPVIYINLPEAVDKKERLEATLSELGFKNVYRSEGVKTFPKKIGVAIAHQAALQYAVDNFDCPVIILEDDCDPFVFRQEIELPDDSDAYYLGISNFGLHKGQGHMKISAEKVTGNHSYRLYNMLSAHAILYFNKEYMNFLIRTAQFYIDTSDNQDKGRAETMKYWKIYAAREPLFCQSGKFRANTGVRLPVRHMVGKHDVFLNS